MLAVDLSTAMKVSTSNSNTTANFLISFFLKNMTIGMTPFPSHCSFSFTWWGLTKLAGREIKLLMEVLNFQSGLKE